MPVDLVGDVLRVNKTLSTGVSGQIVSPPKTPKSNRSIRLDPVTVDLLRPLCADPSRPIFCKPDGSYWSLSRPGHWMDRLADLAGVPRISPHLLRHTHCALMFESGAGLAAVQERLGHDDVEITLRIYNHVSTRSRSEVVDRFASFLADSVESR